MTGQDKLKPADRESGIAALMDYIKGGSDYGSIFEAYPDLTFDDLEREILAAIPKATVSEREQLHFNLALCRSLRYAVASSRHCLILGAVNGIRELYEGNRLTRPLQA